MSRLLKLMALDTDDLKVISAHGQDAVLKSSQIDHAPETQQVSLPMNRFVWEAKSARRWFFKKYERRLSVLTFNRVRGVRSKGIDKSSNDQVLSLLSIEFIPANNEDPSGTILLNFGGGAALAFTVECIEVQLTDLGAAWSAEHKPRHAV